MQTNNGRELYPSHRLITMRITKQDGKAEGLNDANIGFLNTLNGLM